MSIGRGDYDNQPRRKQGDMERGGALVGARWKRSHPLLRVGMPATADGICLGHADGTDSSFLSSSDEDEDFCN